MKVENEIFGPFHVTTHTKYSYTINDLYTVDQGYYSGDNPYSVEKDGVYWLSKSHKAKANKIDISNIKYDFNESENKIELEVGDDYIVYNQSVGYVWFDLKRKEKENNMELSKEDFIKYIINAHMQGQLDNGYMANYGKARAYAEGRWNKLNPDLTNRDVALKITMDYIGATEAIKIETNSNDNRFDVYGTNKGPLPGEISPRIILLYRNKDNGDYKSFYIGKSFSNWKEGKPFESKYEYEEVYFKDVIKGVKES